MPTAVISDTHLGKAAGHDLLRRPETRALLIERLGGADRLVLLGDVIELREGPIGRALEAAEPFLRELGDAMAGKPVTLLCGNHDYQLAGALFDRAAISGGRPSLAIENTIAPRPGTEGPLGQIAEWLAPADVTLAYPGTWIRPDVYATHGHYLDFHNTVPTIEILAIGIVHRIVARRARDMSSMTPGDYEAALAPVYELAYTVAQSSADERQLAGGGRSVRMWERLNGSRRGLQATVEAKVLTEAVVPAAVAALNRIGIGPFKAELTAVALREAGLEGMRAMVSALGIGARHVIFGHTHRSGPWPERGDVSGWGLPGGGRLWNSGSWIHEPVFLRGDDPLASPYFPGVIVWVDDEPGSAPRPERVLGPHDLPAV